MSSYEVVDLTTGKVLHRGEDRQKAAKELQRLQSEGVRFDSLDLVKVDIGTRQSQLIRDHESAVRKMTNEAEGRTYRSYGSLAEAREDPNAAMVIEGDYGGQILATAPVSLIGCSEDRLKQLAQELEDLAWPGNGGESQSVLFEPAPAGSSVGGGMGGGIVTEDVWVHEELRQLGLAGAIGEILRGERQSMPEADPEVPEEVREGVLRAYRDRADVFCHVFGFPAPSHMGSLHIDEWKKREATYAPPPANFPRWYASTYRAIARRAGYDVPAIG